jgi:hypothetical protein
MSTVELSHRPPACPELAERAAGRGSLEGAWIEIFKAGDYGDRGNWSPEDLDRLAASYNPRLQAAPVVLGHPADDAPAYGWVRGLRRAGASLWAQLEKVDPAFEALLRAGRFRQRSAALYTHFPPTGGPYLRHVGFLGAAPPAVKALAPLRFVAAPAVTVEFASESSLNLENAMPETKSTLENFLAHLRSFFSAPASGEESASADSSSAFSDRLAQLEQRLDSLMANRPPSEESPGRARACPLPSDGLAHFGVAQCKPGLALPNQETPRLQEVALFIESLRRRGRFPPVFDLWGVPQFMERLAAADAQLPSGSGDDGPQGGTSSSAVPAEAAPSLTVWFQDFLTRLPAVIDFREISAAPTSASARGSRATEHGTRLVSFTDPQRGVTIDPASIELAERAEALAAELGITYAEALTQLRQEHRHTPTTA